MLEQEKIRLPLALAAGALSCLIPLAGCRVGPRYQPPAPPVITAPNFKESTVNFHNAEGWKVASPQAAMIRGNWWEVFHEPELNALEDQLNINNQNIKTYFQNFMAARAVIAQAHAQYWPTITLAPTYTRAHTSGNQSVSSAATTGRNYSLWNVPVNVSWAPDIWGRIRNEVHQTEYAAQVSAADLQVEKLTEQASLAEFYFEIRGQDMLQRILDQTVAADQKALDAAQGAYDAGTGDYISVIEAKSTLQSAQSADINVGLLRAQYENAIAMLLGRVATDFTLPVKPMVYTPPSIPTGVPSELLERRPDIAAAERTLAEANATIGIGYSAFFPQATIRLSGGTQSALFKHIADWPSRVWSVGPTVSQVLFNGWLYRAEFHQYVAIYNADLSNYRQTVLTAFLQVENALAATRIYSQQILKQQQAVASAQQYLNLEMDRYNAGVDPYINVVIAQTTLLNDQVTLNSLHVNEMLAAVQLVQDLGGGWNRTDLPTPAQVAAKTANADYTLQH